MIEIDCWQSNFKSCVYSDLLINKLTLINEQSANKIDIEEVKKAIYYAKKYHCYQMRESGEPYYSHPIEVALIVADYCFKIDVIVTSLLHDTIEDTKLTKQMIEYIFGSTIADNVENLTRIKIDKKITTKESVESLWMQEKKDLLLVKLCDRLHNMRTIRAKSPEKIKKITHETIHIFIILAIYLETFIIAEEIIKICRNNLNISNKDVFFFNSVNDSYRLPFLNF